MSITSQKGFLLSGGARGRSIPPSPPKLLKNSWRRLCSYRVTKQAISGRRQPYDASCYRTGVHAPTTFDALFFTMWNLIVEEELKLRRAFFSTHIAHFHRCISNVHHVEVTIFFGNTRNDHVGIANAFDLKYKIAKKMLENPSRGSSFVTMNFSDLCPWEKVKDHTPPYNGFGRVHPTTKLVHFREIRNRFRGSRTF